VPVATELIDLQYKQTTEYHRRILYIDSWHLKDKYISQYIEAIDSKRDSNLQQLVEANLKLVKRYNELLRKNTTDVEQLAASQSIQTRLFQQTQRLHLANKALKQVNIRCHKQKNTPEKAVHFTEANAARTTIPKSPSLPSSPLKKTKLSAKKIPLVRSAP
jgi:hypothetical protein